MIAFMAMGVQTVSAQYAKVMLQHQGKATLFEYTEVQKAIDASVDGDTIYIGEGPYNNSAISIQKKITIMGQGTGSQLGDITISLPGGSEMTSTILYGVSAGSVTISSSVTNLHIDKCTMTNLTIQPNSTTTTKTYSMKDMVIERCRITNRFNAVVSDQFENAIVRNCYITYFSNNSKDLSFINCTLHATYAQVSYYSSSGYYNDVIWGSYINCIIDKSIDRYGDYNGSRYGGYSVDNSASFVNCLLGFLPSAGTKTDCYSVSDTSFSKEELQVKGYLGTDGTIVGCNGGARPYNLVPAVPSLEDIKLDVNYNTKKLNVTVKVKAN